MNQAEKMERPSYLSSPSFWKLLMEEDFNRGIRIPHSFSNHLERRKSPCNYSIITEDKKSGSSDRSWRAKLVKKDHYFYLCKKSWPEFVKYHDLRNGDLLLFHLVGKTTFRVTPYCANGSIKKLDDDDDRSSDDDKDSDTIKSEPDEEDEDVRVPTEHRQDRKHRMDNRGWSSAPMSKKARKSSDFKVYKTEESDPSDEDDEPREFPRRAGRKYGKVYGGCNRAVDENSRKEIQRIKTAEEASKWDHYYDLGVQKPYFIRTVKRGHRYKLVVPRPFALAVGLDKVKEVELLSEDGDRKRSWSAKMLVGSNLRRDRIDIGDGWQDFRRRFDIRTGDTCRFTVTNRSDTHTISVHVFPSR